MSTESLYSRDGSKIVFDIAGNGPTIILLHGLSQYRELWHRYGWFDELAATHTVIAPDIRGAGDSEAVVDKHGHDIRRYIGDVEALISHSGNPNAIVWGWSFGGAVALQVAARSRRISAVIASGTHFGCIFTTETIEKRLADLAAVEKAAKSGAWDGIPEQRRITAERTDFDAARARLRALHEWPTVEPYDIGVGALVISGENDGRNAALLRERSAAIERAGIDLHVFDELNHVDLVARRDVVSPLIHRFLAGIAQAEDGLPPDHVDHGKPKIARTPLAGSGRSFEGAVRAAVE